MTMLRTWSVVAAVLSLLVAAGCSDDDPAASGGSDTLTILAASSLTDVFDDLAEVYEQEHDGVEVRLTYDSSSTLAEQVIQGAPADILATADEGTMQGVVDEGLTASEPVVFARNMLILVTPLHNPADIASIEDLNNPDVDWAVCVPGAPCGIASEKVLGIVNVTSEPVTEEANVRDTLTKVTAGEVDAGLVYVSDAQAAGDDVQSIEVPEASQAINADVIAPLDDAADAELAQDWIDLVTSNEGQQALEGYGFLSAS
ncbi:MAG: molybdate ABC transporter substrate-binding protein [Actinomycetota bacterium]|nr:molybdate ABC transporter substrate-binding protein [Actinomycetota bacterium]